MCTNDTKHKNELYVPPGPRITYTLGRCLWSNVPSLFAQCLTEAIIVECRQDVEVREGCYVREVRTNQRHSSVTIGHISHVFGIGLNASKQTIAITTHTSTEQEVPHGSSWPTSHQAKRSVVLRPPHCTEVFHEPIHRCIHFHKRALYQGISRWMVQQYICHNVLRWILHRCRHAWQAEVGPCTWASRA
jgi:hypothetical protein